MKRLFALAIIALTGLVASTAGAQPVDVPTTNRSATITAGNTFQTILAATTNSTDSNRRSLTIQNNQTSTDNCWIFVGSGSATKGTSILLAPGQAYTRYFPFIPSDAIQGTCTSTNDTIYVDTQ